MEKQTAQLIVTSAHHDAVAISSCRPDLPGDEQETRYSRVYVTPLEETVASTDICDLLEALDRLKPDPGSCRFD